MSKLRPIYVLIPGVVLVIATICVLVFVLLPPVNSEIQKVSQERDQEQAKADERPQAEKRKADAERKLKDQMLKLERYMKTRSIPISFYLPTEAMIKFWYELQEDLAPSLEKYIESSGCRIIQGAALPAPQMSPPTVGPSNFIRIPQSGALQFTVQGTAEELRKLYTGLNQFDRVATIEPLNLRPIGGGEELEAEVGIVVYILAEGPEGAAAAAPGAAAGGAPGGMPAGGMMMGAPGAGPPGAGPPGASAPKGGAPKGGDEGGGGLKGRDAGGGDE